MTRSCTMWMAACLPRCENTGLLACIAASWHGLEVAHGFEKDRKDIHA